MESIFTEHKSHQLNNKLNAFESNTTNEKMDNKEKSTTIILQNIEKMTSSVGSIVEDTTPSDSGVQMLDSESSELNESLMSSSGFDFDSGYSEINNKTYMAIDSNNDLCSMTTAPTNLLAQSNDVKNEILTKSDIANSNICQSVTDMEHLQISDELISSTHSTFDTENIVYRRRAKKTKNHSSAPKKRVSFHEDILKNTKTDNIHIEHGFITYKSYLKKNPQVGRYSWCSEGDSGDFNESNHVYRNACSDVLDYGKTDIYEDQKPSNFIHVDNSGVFEYGPHYKTDNNKKTDFYKCNCSSSNSSLDSGSSQSDENNTNSNYAQAKSNSCECIGITQNNNNNNNLIITENCYYSEPSIEILNENNLMNGKKPISVWSKDKKPKSSCLKKSKRHTDILQEYDLNTKVKKFNVHPLSDMNNLIDNSKMIFGSLKNIFSIPLPERGVPEGSEDLQSVCECIPENENFMLKPRTFLSKSLDGGFKDLEGNMQKNYVHNVDEQLRRKNDDDLYAPTRNTSRDFVIVTDEPEFETIETIDPVVPEIKPVDILSTNYRNKFIINCESTVFEHTGVSYCYDKEQMINTQINQMKKSSFSTNPLKQKLSNIFKTFTDNNTNNSATTISTSSTDGNASKFINTNTDSSKIYETSTSVIKSKKIDELKSSDFFPKIMDLSFTSSCSDKESTMSDLSATTTTTTDQNCLNKIVIGTNNSPRKNRHLASPARKKPAITTRYERTRMSPDLFNSTSVLRDIKNSNFSDDFDDILTITTTSTDTQDNKNNSDIIIVDYNTDNNINDKLDNNFLKPTTSKSSLINRFLRNVTQKKIHDASIKKNITFITKLKTEKKLFENLYIKGGKIPNQNLMADFNAEIAMEIEMSNQQDPKQLNIKQKFEMGVGEVSIEIFNGNYLHILRSDQETLMKAFKLYTGYSKEGYMTPVIVFLTDKTLYVTDLVRNRLCNKFVLPYTDLDIILMGPYGNTVLLSNVSRDMQQVLLAGGPYPADGIVASLEMCARRGGSTLPAVGQLTLDHLAPLQAFVCDNSLIPKNDVWVYYSVVNVPANALNHDEEPLGPNVKGPLMHRNIELLGGSQPWHAGYFLLKAGVLYMFNDAAQKLPTWAVALAECQGVRRSVAVGRPHCFELLLKTGVLQLAAPDEYVASEWLQALVQSASGLFEMQEKHSTLGCTLIMTPNHLITVREDFSAPLRRLNLTSPTKENIDPNVSRMTSMTNSLMLDSISDISSITSNLSTPTRRSYSNMSTPTKLKQMLTYIDEKSYTSMSSFYGKNSGVKILTCAALKEMIAVKISPQTDNWWCILEFSCQEVRENSDDLVIFFATNSELQRFLSMLESIWQSKNDGIFPISILSDDDYIGEHCSKLFTDLNKSWEPLLSAALGFPQ